MHVSAYYVIRVLILPYVVIRVLILPYHTDSYCLILNAVNIIHFWEDRKRGLTFFVFSVSSSCFFFPPPLTSFPALNGIPAKHGER
jgi:hypothetical protein